ncbi:tumor necrosis factor receptor superfamily member 10B-like [Tautogolabrus adspersus]
MTTLLEYVVWMVLFFANHTGGFQTSGIRKIRREIYCEDEKEYRNGDMCCLKCPAGYRMISPCNEDRRRGKCEKCDDGTFTEHSNDFKNCFPCTQCRSDQDIVKPCSQTQNTECQCRSGGFCAPDQACEVCKTCSRCDKDEETVKNCTSTTNTECKKTQPSPASASASQRNRPVGHKGGQDDCEGSLTEERRNTDTQRLSYPKLILSGPLVRTQSFVEDERRGLCESVSSSSSNSQHSLTGLPSSAFPMSPPRASLIVPQPQRRVRPQLISTLASNLASLLPAYYLSEESLRKCFEYFEDMNVDYVKRFFRNIGMSDNVIKNKEHLSSEDKIHELLNIWVEKEGKEARLNDLLKALLDLNQRLTAETVKKKAVDNGHYHL